MKNLGSEKALNAIKQKIDKKQRELEELEKSNKPIPELINSANLVRQNEILKKINDTKTELVAAYESYNGKLENILGNIIKIQTQIKNSLKTKSRRTPRKKKKWTRKKPSKKRRSKKR